MPHILFQLELINAVYGKLNTMVVFHVFYFLERWIQPAQQQGRRIFSLSSLLAIGLGVSVGMIMK